MINYSVYWQAQQKKQIDGETQTESAQEQSGNAVQMRISNATDREHLKSATA